MPRRRFFSLCSVLVMAALGIAGWVAIDHYGLEALIALVSMYGVVAIIFTESGVPLGFFLPGDSLIFTTGFLLQQRVISFDIHLAALLLFVAAVLGNCAGYSFGRHVGTRLFRRKDSAVFHARNLRHARDFYRQHGGKTIIIARFIPVVRTFAPIIAGVSRMPYRRFMFFNVAGALIWAVGYSYLGYFAGAWSEATGFHIQYVVLGIIFCSLIPIIASIIIRARRSVR